MTDKVNPSVNRPAEAFETAGSIGYGGHATSSDQGFVVDGASTTELANQDSDISESNLNTFNETSSSSSFDVDIDAGEAFIFGAWVAIDTTTTVTLSSSTNNQTVFVGWNKDAPNDVIVGTSGDFASGSNDTDINIPLWDFDTDGSGVTSSTDRRTIGYIQGATQFDGDIDLNNNNINSTASLNRNASDGDLEVTLQGDGTNTGSDIRLRTQNSSGTIQDGLLISNASTSATVTIPNGPLNFSNSNTIQDSGTDAIQFDGSQNVTFANGNVILNGNVVTEIGGTTDASVGALRMPNDALVAWRNSGGTDDHSIEFSTSDEFELRIDSNREFAVGTGSVNIQGSDLIQAGGTTDASAGAIRLANDTDINWRNAGDSADIGITVSANNNLVLGANTAPGTISAQSDLDFSNSNSIQDAGTNALTFDGSGNVGVANTLEDSSGNTMLNNVVSSQSITLSSGSATIDTGVGSGTTATFMVAIGPDTDDADIAADVRAASGGNYEVDIEETDTNVGNPTVEVDVIRVR